MRSPTSPTGGSAPTDRHTACGSPTARRRRVRPSVLAVPRRSALHVPCRSGPGAPEGAGHGLRARAGGRHGAGPLSYVPAPATFTFDGKERPVGDQLVDGPGRGVLPIRHVRGRRERHRGGAFARRTEDGFAGPAVSIDGPADGTTTGESSLKVPGGPRTTWGSRLTVNGRPVAVDGDGSFSAVVALGTGSNRIAVVATEPRA